MDNADFITIIRYAWIEYDVSRKVKHITDISAMVSTNHVYKIDLEDKNFVIAKLSHFGKFDDFVEDHTIINVLSNNLPYPFANVLSRSLMKGEKIFVHRFKNEQIDAAVVFYRPVKIRKRPPQRLEEDQIIAFGKEMAKFHKACYTIRHTLPKGSKSLRKDIGLIEQYIHLDTSNQYNQDEKELILRHCNTYKIEVAKLHLPDGQLIPVFIDWNIGNFSVSSNFKLYSRWDYDWFRTTTRVMDFYFLSRVVSDAGDQKQFTYNISTLLEDRFLLFLTAYDSVFKLTRDEVLMIREAYRFFILNYVVRHGGYFFKEPYADQLTRDALDTHLKTIDQFDSDILTNHLGV